MLNLPEVTLICLTNKDYAGHQKAIDRSTEHIRFGGVKLIWDETIDSIDTWNYKVIYELHHYVQTPFALLIHANGYVVHPESWKDEWLQYDYAGSPFPLPQDDFSYRDVKGEIQRVGNSVGLRSKRLMELPSKIGMEWKPFHGYFNEDGYISVNMRHVFEEHGCKFMPLEEAVHFGRENEIPENQDIDNPFVFHNYLGRNRKYL